MLRGPQCQEPVINGVIRLARDATFLGVLPLHWFPKNSSGPEPGHFTSSQNWATSMNPRTVPRIRSGSAILRTRICNLIYYFASAGKAASFIPTPS